MAVFQHKYDEMCPSDAIITFAIEKLDQSRGRPVACVLMNAAEVAIFHHELVYSTNALPAEGVTVLADPNDFWTDKQRKLWLMTYPQLSDIIAVSQGRPEEDLSLLLHLGCGEYTWDIVRACHDWWKWAWDVEVGKENATVRVYTISNLQKSIYCDASASRLSMVGLTRPILVRRRPETLEFSAAIAHVQQQDAAHKELLTRIQDLQQPPKQTNRAVVFTSRGKLLEAYDRHNCQPTGYVQLSGDMTGLDLSDWVEVLLQREFDVKTLLVEPNVGTIGTVRNLGTVLVLPVRQGFFFDTRLSHVVLRQDMHMSRAEVRYACRVAVRPRDSGTSPVPAVFFFTKSEFGKLPPAPTGALAFTGDFPAVLLHFCDHSYFDSDKTSPIRLPKDEKMTEEYLRRLELRGLTERRGGPLTDLGRTTAWWHHSGRIRNFNVANLLAIASTAQGTRASALIQIAAVLYHPGSSLMSSIACFLKIQIPEGKSADFHSLLPEDTKGFARTYLERGPIWIAVAVWARARTFISRWNLMETGEFSTCNDMLHVSRQMIKVVENNWVAMSQAWKENQGGAPIDDKPLINEEDFLFLEECIVRVWMHNLVLVGMTDPEQDVFACDLTSGAFIARPSGDPVRWAWLAQEVDSKLPEGEPSKGVFAVYTVLHRLTAPDGRIQYVPEDLTFVSTRAVRRVIQDVATSKRREGFRLPDEHDLLRTKYPIWFEPDESDE
ncbi:hypothetical protein SLS64_010892 [Diaporthe eres]|uniref:Uncharacterized protein n=1 Tax=Diaporthe eres TaxID=83184 RepID=A0ABR1P6U5_DIAER